jgi:hypothetical protein
MLDLRVFSAALGEDIVALRHSVCTVSAAFLAHNNQASKKGIQMRSSVVYRAGKVKYALLGWLIGLPLPIVIILLFFRGCDF